jgi:hypothetical protein
MRPLSVAAAVLAVALAPAADRTAGMTKGTPELKSISALAFGPDGILFVGDATAGTIYAVATGDTKAGGKDDISVDDLKTTAGDLFGAKADTVTINDVKANPASGSVYVAVTRGKDAAVVKFERGGKKPTEFAFKDVLFSSVKLPNATDKNRAEAITSMAYVQGQLVVAGLSNEEFASTLRAIPFPFKDADKGTAVEIYHAAHGKLDTNSPVRTFTPYTVGGADYIIASYTCTPLVRIPVADLKPGKLKGTTVAELGSQNRPLDVITYTKDKKDYALMANDRRGVMKIDLAGIDKAEAIEKKVSGGGVAGVTFEKVSDLEGVTQLDKLDDDKAVIVVVGKDKTTALKTIKLP